MTNPPATADPGTSFDVTDTVKNQGTDAAGASETRYYLATDKVKNATAILLTGSRSVPGLAAGQTSTGTATVTIPVATARGYYALLACADDTNLVTETNETNNCRVASLSVKVGTPTIMPGTSAAGYLAPATTGHCNNGLPADRYVLTIAVGTTAQISVTGKALDTYFCVLNGNNIVIAQDDDSGSGTNPQTAITLAAGSYYVEVTSFSGVDKGAYTLAVKSLSITPVTTISLGQTVVENLSTTAAKAHCYPYTAADRYQLTITASTLVTIDASSWDFNTYACLLDANNNFLASNDNSGPGNNARVTHNIASPGTYYVEVTSAPGTSGSGTYTLSAQTGYPKAKTAQIKPKVQGSLVGFEAEANCYPNSPAIRYTFNITTPGVYTIDVGSTAFNTFVCVLDANLNFIAADNDLGPGSNSRIIHNYGTGTYYLEVTTAPGTSGAGLFTYQLYSGYPKPDLIATVGTPASKTLSSNMAEGNCYPNSPAYRIQFKLMAASIVTIDVGSTAFDPYACLLDANLNFIAADNNLGPGSGARITGKNLDIGTYNLQVMAAPGTSGSGAFTASIYLGYPMPDKVMNLGDLATATLSSVMAEANCYPNSPAYRIQFTLTAASIVTIDVGSTAFDPYACLLDANLNFIAADNNLGPGSGARIIGKNLDIGTYNLQVMAAPGTSGSGAFTASIQPGYPPGTPITVGQNLSGTLTGSEAESVCYPNGPTERYQFKLAGTQTVTILATSTAFDSYLNLEDANDNCIASDNNSGGGMNAKITKTLNTGQYYIEVTTAPGTSGNGAFTLSLN